MPKLAEVDALPCAEYELALGDGQGDGVAEEGGFEVRDRVAVMSAAATSSSHRA